MTQIREVRDAIAHINDWTGDPNAWRHGLTPADMAVLLPAVVIDDGPLAGLLTKIRANHPALFDPATGAPITPKAPSPSPAPPDQDQGQRGEAADAMKKAEHDLAQQNSTAARLDLHVITAILTAHATTVEGGDDLQRLQHDVENAVRHRTDLDTPAGARDFQRYLIDKLRQIGAVVETAHLDDMSKAAMAGAWTALYESAAAGPTSTPVPAAESAAEVSSAPEAGLPAYGADSSSASADPLLDQLLGDDLEAQMALPPDVGAVPDAPPPPAAPMPMMSGLPSPGGGAPPSPGGGLGGLPTALGGPRMDEGTSDSSPTRPSGVTSLDDLLREEGLLDEPETDTADRTSGEGDVPAEPSPDDPAPGEPTVPAGPTEVRLPNGDTVTVSNPKIAKVIEAAIGGTPIGDAFHQQGITVPPAGTAVAHPLDPGRLGSGDIGMFTDRQALALDRERALFDGQIQPVASVSGPSFLGWMHPPGQGTTPSAAAPSTAPESAGSPQPTRPAATSAGPTG